MHKLLGIRFMEVRNSGVSMLLRDSWRKLSLPQYVLSLLKNHLWLFTTLGQFSHFWFRHHWIPAIPFHFLLPNQIEFLVEKSKWPRSPFSMTPQTSSFNPDDLILYLQLILVILLFWLNGLSSRKTLQNLPSKPGYLLHDPVNNPFRYLPSDFIF